nr:VOC family protein [Modestobacter altitudinis]
MWWGTAIEAPDPGALARFYAALLDWPVGHEEPGTTILMAPEGSIYVCSSRRPTTGRRCGRRSRGSSGR